MLLERNDLRISVVSLDQREAVDHLVEMIGRLSFKQNNAAVSTWNLCPYLTEPPAGVKLTDLCLFLLFLFHKVGRQAFRRELLLWRENHQILHMNILHRT